MLVSYLSSDKTLNCFRPYFYPYFIIMAHVHLMLKGVDMGTLNGHYQSNNCHFGYDNGKYILKWSHCQAE